MKRCTRPSIDRPRATYCHKMQSMQISQPNAQTRPAGPPSAVNCVSACHKHANPSSVIETWVTHIIPYADAALSLRGSFTRLDQLRSGCEIRGSGFSYSISPWFLVNFKDTFFQRAFNLGETSKIVNSNWKKEKTWAFITWFGTPDQIHILV